MNSQPIETRRHSYAHLLAAAIEKLFPGTKFGVGPVVEHGFYYDVLSPTPLHDEDLVKLTSAIKKFIKEKLAFERSEMSLDDAIKFFKDKGQDFKVELLGDLKKHGTTTMKEEEREALGEAPKTVSLYTTGGFADLCRGPHVLNTKDLNPDSFKLTSIAGAYWRGSEKNPQLQRVYGIAFETKEELEDYINLQEELEKRDHRKLGKQLGLFVISDLIGPGLPLYTPKGTFMRRQIQDYSRELRETMGYEEVHTPNINKAELFKVSGHYAKYKENLFGVSSNFTDEEYFLKPMNCPQHTQLYASEMRSYKDLPIRFADFANLYRDEKPGELSGLTRLRAFSQDDGHCFCREDQTKEEFRAALMAIHKAMNTYGLTYRIRLSVRDESKKEQYLGSDEIWKKSQTLLEELLKEEKVDYFRGEGEAAFYGPKMDLMVKDSLSREWQLSTIQLDFNTPVNFRLEYIGEDGNKHTPAMIHSALIGSVERFMALLIEHYAGAFPVWLAPVQVVVAAISEKQQEYGKKVYEKLFKAGIRVELRDDSETIGKKIRETETQKIPYMLIVGDKEVEAENVAVRKRSEGDKGQVSLDEFIVQILEEIKTHK